MQVTTVTGPVAPADLGRALVHEHFSFGYPGCEADRTMWPTHRNSEDAVMAAVADAVSRVREYGVTTVIDLTPNDCGRDVELLRRISREHDLQIVCATGLYHEGDGASGYFSFRRLYTDIAAELTELFVAELTEGVAGTGIRAGVIKVATSAGTITEYEQAVITAAARAQQATGAPIITHTSHGTMGPEQARALLAAGADPAKVVVGHMCGNLDRDYQLATLATGVRIAYDRIGCNRMFNDITDDDRIESIVALAGLGHLGRIVLSHDWVAHWQGRSAQGFHDLPGARHWSPSRIGEHIVPGLLARGLGEDEVDRLLVGNVRSLWED